MGYGAFLLVLFLLSMAQVNGRESEPSCLGFRNANFSINDCGEETATGRRSHSPTKPTNEAAPLNAQKYGIEDTKAKIDEAENRARIYRDLADLEQRWSADLDRQGNDLRSYIAPRINSTDPAAQREIDDRLAARIRAPKDLQDLYARSGLHTHADLAAKGDQYSRNLKDGAELARRYENFNLLEAAKGRNALNKMNSFQNQVKKDEADLRSLVGTHNAKGIGDDAKGIRGNASTISASPGKSPKRNEAESVSKAEVEKKKANSKDYRLRNKLLANLFQGNENLNFTGSTSGASNSPSSSANSKEAEKNKFLENGINDGDLFAGSIKGSKPTAGNEQKPNPAFRLGVDDGKQNDALLNAIREASEFDKSAAIEGELTAGSLPSEKSLFERITQSLDSYEMAQLRRGGQ